MRHQETGLPLTLGGVHKPGKIKNRHVPNVEKAVLQHAIAFQGNIQVFSGDFPVRSCAVAGCETALFHPVVGVALFLELFTFQINIVPRQQQLTVEQHACGGVEIDGDFLRFYDVGA